MTIIIPCCGESQRFNGIKKQFIKMPNGLPLPIFSQSGIIGHNDKVYTFLENDFIANYGDTWVWNGNLCLLPKATLSQVDTVRQTILKCDLLNKSIFIKDCDNYFEAKALPNTVIVRSINNATFKLHNKSYTKHDSSRLITRIAERTQISNCINVGGYGFISGELFLRFSEGKKFITELINAAMKAGIRFRADYCENYIDYGEQDDYDNFIKEFKLV